MLYSAIFHVQETSVPTSVDQVAISAEHEDAPSTYGVFNFDIVRNIQCSVFMKGT